MDSRGPWQALQSRLTNAREAVESGDRPRALAEISAALEIDPHFLAAQSLRDRILAEAAAPVMSRAPAAPSPTSPASASPANAGPVSTEGYAKFEQRARRRRVDRRLDAARAALDGGHLRAAGAALEEVTELDANLPELAELTVRFNQLQRRAATPARGPRFAAAAVFAIMLLGASWLHESTSLFSRPVIIAGAALVAAPEPAAVPSEVVPREFVPPEFVPVGTTAARQREPEADFPARIIEAPRARASVEPASAMREPSPIEVAEIAALPPPPVVAPPRQSPVMQDSPVVAAVSVSIPPPAALLADESQLVQQTLQRYRTAYEGLDARSAHAVWPAVNQAALARAFDGLESQSLTFDACDVRVRGESAIAVCQGSARYVPKIGNRQPRTESRVWNFSLRKAGTDWKIDSARAEK